MGQGGGALDSDRSSMMRLALALSVLAMVGLASLLAAPVETLLPIDAPVAAVRALAIVQPAILAAVAIIVGLALARRTGLTAPFLAGTLAFDPKAPETRLPIQLAVLVALSAGAGLAAYQIVAQSWLAELNPVAATQMSVFTPPLVTRALYGGLTEEIISRWGAMTFFVWVLGVVPSRAAVRPTWTYWAAAIIAAVLFALGHFPLLLALVPDPPAELVVVILSINTVLGTAFGWLFWKAGLEAAMLAHALTHLLAATLVAVAAVFGFA
jgi:membrane protease YdiL (CAAX protease family)